MDARVFWSFLLLLVILSAALLLLYRSRTADPRYKMISFGVIWFFITLSVESSVIPIVDVINEHRAYLPSLGFFMAAAVSFFIVMDAVHPRYKHIHSAAIILAITVLIALSGAAYARNTVWKSEVSLWLDVASKSPNKARAFFNLGNAFAFKGRGDLANAGKAWERAMQIDPAFKARVFFNLGNALRDRGDMTSAEKAWERAIESDATFSAAFNQLGVVSYRKKSFETARYYYSRAIQADIENVQAYYNLAMTLEKLRDLDGAAAQYEIFLTKVTPEYYHLIPMVKERLAAPAKKR